MCTHLVHFQTLHEEHGICKGVCITQGSMAQRNERLLFLQSTRNNCTMS